MNFNTLKRYYGAVSALPDSILLNKIAVERGEYILILALGGVKESKEFTFLCNDGTLNEIHFKSSNQKGGDYSFCTTLYIARLSFIKNTSFTLKHTFTYSSDSLFEAYEAALVKL